MRTQHDSKRIVSKTQYAGIIGGRLMEFAASSLFFIVGLVGMILWELLHSGLSLH